MSQRKTTRDIRNMKGSGRKIAALTAYDHFTAKVLDESETDIILVGDSLGMVFSGYETTLPVKVEDVFYHATTVSRGAREALVVADMPFLSYQVDEKSAIENCGRFIKEGASQAVKIEGGSDRICSLIEHLTEIGIPVMGHIGLTPQLVHTLGGFRTQGKNREDAIRIQESAKQLEEAGAFCMVLEAIPADLAREITEASSVPTIGIGAGPHCDGQILVVSDVLGMFDEFQPKFARRYADLGKEIRKAVKAYVRDVRQQDFPSDSESFH